MMDSPNDVSEASSDRDGFMDLNNLLVLFLLSTYFLSLNPDPISSLENTVFNYVFAVEIIS